MTYSSDFRRKVLAVREREGLTIKQVAARFSVGIASVVRWINRVEPKQHGYRHRKVDMEALGRDVRDYPDAYQYERAARFGVHANAISHGLKKLNVSYKKNTATPKSRRRRTAYLPAED